MGLTDQINNANSNPDEFYKTIQKCIEKKSDDSKAVISAELEKSQLRITEIDKFIQGLFEAKVRGEIDGSLFASLKKTYDEEKEQLNTLVAELISNRRQRFVSLLRGLHQLQTGFKSHKTSSEDFIKTILSFFIGLR